MVSLGVAPALTPHTTSETGGDLNSEVWQMVSFHAHLRHSWGAKTSIIGQPGQNRCFGSLSTGLYDTHSRRIWKQEGPRRIRYTM